MGFVAGRIEIQSQELMLSLGPLRGESGETRRRKPARLVGDNRAGEHREHRERRADYPPGLTPDKCSDFPNGDWRPNKMALTQESILSFLLERGGKVKNSELLHHFRSRISCGDPAEKQHNRDLFKKLVNSVAVVKQVDEVKFVVVKKRYQDFVKEAAHDGSPTRIEESFCTGFPFISPQRAEPEKVLFSDLENNNNISHPLNPNDAFCCTPKRSPAGSPPDRRPLPRGNGADTTSVKVLNLSGDQVKTSGAVFAVVAVKSPPRSFSPAAQGGSQVQLDKTRLDKPAVPAFNCPAYRKGAQRDSKCWTQGTCSVPQIQPPNKTLRQGEDSKCSECVPLEPLAHEWLVKCAAGLWGQICTLMERDARLVLKKDFMSGFTVLHWAAKDGSCEMMQKILDSSRKAGAYANVNSKAHGGYTPLHIAAIHGHADMMVLLVQRYGASVGERDNYGKKAFHYLGRGVPDEVRALVRGAQLSNERQKSQDEEEREHSKGFNSISKLFQPHAGKKHKALKFAADWLE